MTASLYRKYNTFSDRESEQQHRTMTFFGASKPSPSTNYRMVNRGYTEDTGIKSHKRSVLRRQSRDTNRNIKRSVYCQYG